ncbi:Uncharacterised protein [Candidatus Norongarragalina meridionalis]|nr:Uncharacterised protein [Candidatus Norongarragalina meridionalis]
MVFSTASCGFSLSETYFMSGCGACDRKAYDSVCGGFVLNTIELGSFSSSDGRIVVHPASSKSPPSFFTSADSTLCPASFVQ